MVSFPDFSNFSSNPDIGDLLNLPNASYPYYWGWILAGLTLIIALTLYFKEKETTGRGKLISSVAVASLATLLLSVIGTIVGFIPNEILIYHLVLTLIITAIWFFNSS